MTGFRHSFLVYEEDRDLMESVRPFLLEGLAKGEASLVTVPPSTARRLAPGLPGEVDFEEEYESPLAALEWGRSKATEILSRGTPGIRVVAQVPPTRLDEPMRDRWIQYEAAVNELFAGLPIEAVCLYDRSRLPCELDTDLSKVHPLRRDGEQVENQDEYMDPRRFLDDQARCPFPIQQETPQVEITDVDDPRMMREAIRAEGRAQGIDGPALDDFLLAITETWHDLRRDAGARITARVWFSDTTLVGTLEHSGPGPDPLVGFFLPEPPRREGLGIPIARRFVDRLDISPTPGCLVRLASEHR